MPTPNSAMDVPCCYSPWRLLVTRPQAQAESWLADLAVQGFKADAISLLAIEPLEGEAEQQAIKNQIMNLDNYAKVIFVSQNAVVQGMHWIDNYWPQLPMKLAFYAVGATTAKQLASYGVQVEDLALAAAGAMNSESLLQAASLQAVAHEKILIVRGQGGRGHLAEVLRARGAQVEYCEVYRRSLPATAAAELKAWLQQRARDSGTKPIISLHSGESLHNLQQLLASAPELSSSERELITSAPLLVPGERVAEAARAAGWHQIITAQNATDVAMTQALAHYCQAHSP